MSGDGSMTMKVGKADDSSNAFYSSSSSEDKGIMIILMVKTNFFNFSGST
jgi:hypothetical protein